MTKWIIKNLNPNLNVFPNVCESNRAHESPCWPLLHAAPRHRSPWEGARGSAGMRTPEHLFLVTSSSVCTVNLHSTP